VTMKCSVEDWIQVVTVAESPKASPGEQMMERQRAKPTARSGRCDAAASAEDDVLAEATQRLGARRVRVTVTARRGHAATEVLAAAREFGAQWLVLGAKGSSRRRLRLWALSRERCVGEHHDLCREHATGDHLETIKRGETATKVWWEIVETKAVPIPITANGDAR
jgi:Universal stress protein family